MLNEQQKKEMEWNNNERPTELLKNGPQNQKMGARFGWKLVQNGAKRSQQSNWSAEDDPRQRKTATKSRYGGPSQAMV